VDQAWEILEHTADVGVQARGETLARLFENAAAGMLGIAYDPASVGEREQRAIAAEASDRELLLVNFLDELLWLIDGEHWLPRRVAVGEICETRVSATAFGEPRDASRHTMRTIIKAVTLHLLSVRGPSRETGPGTRPWERWRPAGGPSRDSQCASGDANPPHTQSEACFSTSAKQSETGPAGETPALPGQHAAPSTQRVAPSTQHAAPGTPYWQAEVYFDI